MRVYKRAGLNELGEEWFWTAANWHSLGTGFAATRLRHPKRMANTTGLELHERPASHREEPCGLFAIIANGLLLARPVPLLGPQRGLKTTQSATLQLARRRPAT